jgi:hypothetical protein
VIGILLISKQLQTREKEKRIEALEGPNGIVEDDQGMLKVAVEFYKDLFKKESRADISLAGNF